MDEITTPEQHAEVLSIVTSGEFTPDELLSNAHALLALAPDYGVNAFTSRSCAVKRLRISLGSFSDVEWDTVR